MTDFPFPHNNIGYLCTDWQLQRGLGGKTALKLIDKDENLSEYTFAQLTNLSNQAANLLASYGFQKSDRIMLLLSKTVEMYAFFLGALKLGLVSCILFNSIGEDSIVERIKDTDTKAIISTSRMNFRLVKVLQKLDPSFKVLLVDEDQPDGQFIGIHDQFAQSPTEFVTPDTDPEQYSHFHFTSGSTGKPKAVQHCHAAIIDHLRSFEAVMQPNPEDLYWCTADPGWVTGTTYGITAPWVAYKQFCQHFLAPLALMAKKDIRLAQMMRLHIDGIPLDLASKLLPASTKLNFGLATHIHVHAKSQQRYADKEVSQEYVKSRMSKSSMYGILDSLLSTVRGLNVKTIQTEWTDYYQDNNYTQASFEAKRQLVKSFIEKVNPKHVWDLGGNTGEFSRAASDLQIPTVCFDIDPGAVQQNYGLVKKNKEKFMLPLRMDLTNPSPDLGWHNAERESMQARGPVDLVMALALIHHLAISNNVPLVDVADYFADLGEYLIIEFVPKSDSQVKRLLASRLDIFPDYTLEGFRQAFEHQYLLIDETPIDACERTVFLMKRK